MAYCYDGKTYETIKEMAEEYGIDRQRIYSFRRRGWSLEDAMQMCINDVRGRGRLFEYNGKLYRSPKALAEEYGLPWNSLAHYIQRCKTVEEAVDRCKEAHEKKIMLWGKRYQSRYEVATAFGIKETSISARIHTRNRTLEEIVLELLQKEPICFEGKSYNTLVELCAEYQVQPCNIFERLKYAETYVHVFLEMNGIGEKRMFYIRTVNDGVIIPNEMKEEIFKPFVRFNEKEDGKVTTGTGIGLALSRSLAELHQGSLMMLEGEEANVFCLSLPVEQDSVIKLTSEYKSVEEENVVERRTELADSRGDKPVVLVADDNPDMLSFIVRQLESNYVVVTANDGVEALKVLDNQEVSLVVSDVVMPRMDGFELCKLIKSKLDYSHIPVILLTAKTNIQSKIEGLELGADAYIEKPFSVGYLQACIANLINSREKLRQAFAQSPFVAANTMALTKADEEFMKKLNEIIQNNLHNPDFSMDDIVDSLNMSRSNFYRKIKGVLDLSPNEYLRLERLKRAAQLLKEGNGRVNEICYMVGFNSPSYFSKCFQKQFGVLPKEFAG